MKYSNHIYGWTCKYSISPTPSTGRPIFVTSVRLCQFSFFGGSTLKILCSLDIKPHILVNHHSFWGPIHMTRDLEMTHSFNYFFKSLLCKYWVSTGEIWIPTQNKIFYSIYIALHLKPMSWWIPVHIYFCKYNLSRRRPVSKRWENTPSPAEFLIPLTIGDSFSLSLLITCM